MASSANATVVLGNRSKSPITKLKVRENANSQVRAMAREMKRLLKYPAIGYTDVSGAFPNKWILPTVKSSLLAEYIVFSFSCSTALQMTTHLPTTRCPTLPTLPIHCPVPKVSYSLLLLCCLSSPALSHSPQQYCARSPSLQIWLAIVGSAEHCQMLPRTAR